MKKITPLLVFALLLGTLSSLAQKVAIVGINHTSPDGLAIVALEDLPSGETFYYTDSEYSAASNAFASGEVVVQISLTSAMAKGNIVVLSETATNVLSFACSSGCTGSASVISGNFAIATDGEGHYLYSDTDTDPTNGVTEIFCVVYTGSGEAPSVNGGPIPADEDPSSDFPNAIVVDGFPNTQPDFTEFNPALRSGAVSKSNLEDPANWNHGQANSSPSQTVFDDIDAAVDITLPTITSLTPLNGATDVAVDANLVVEFNEDVQAVSGNNIIILANLVPVVTIPINDSQVTIGGSTLTINPTADLPSNASISVGIPDGGLEDLAGNDFGGIDPTTGWVFTTAVPVDNTPPVITSCPLAIELDSFASNPECGDFVEWEPPMVTDNLPGVIMTSNFEPGDLFPFGTTEVIYTATDAAGNQASCSFMVTVNDKKAPTPICINGLTVTLDATTGLQTISTTDFIASPINDPCGDITYTISRATDDPSADVRVPGLTLSCNDIDITTVRIWAEDVNGNSDYCETNVLVDKSQFDCPIITAIICPADVTIQAGDSTDPSAIGGMATKVLPDEPFIVAFSDSPTPAGIITRTWTGTDVNGSFSSCDQIITIIGYTPPVAVCKDITVTLDALGEKTIEPADIDGGSTNYQDILTILSVNGTDISGPTVTFTTANLGENIVTYRIEDDVMNVATCTAIVTVKSACEVVIDADPQNVEVCENEPYSFSAEATGNGILSYQWEYLFAVGASWDNYPNATENILDIPAQGAVINADGWLFRVRVTSDNGTPSDTTDDCTTTSEAATLTVNPAPMVEITGNDSYCYNGNGVVLDAGAGYSSYLWSPGGETTQTITALEGSYTVTVTNGFGCATTSEAFTVTNNQQMACTIVQDVLTTDHLTADGVATVNPSGGSGVYTYLWDNGETTQTATTLTYGMHSVTVTDSNGCETSCQIDIAKELYCWINLVQNVSVRGGSDGAARVNGNGGFRPFTYTWDDGSTQQLNSKLGAGTHYVVITDATGATSRCSVTITEPTGGNCDSFMATVVQDKLSTDHQTKDGVATVYPKGGTAPFTYLWDNGETTQTATRLTYGLRTVTVTDASGCETSSQIDIAKELYCWINLYGNISVHGGNDGSAMVHGNGGYRPHTYKWDDGSTQQLNTNLGVGTHYVTITDAKGATSRCSITIYQPNEEVCDGVDNDGDGMIDEGFDADNDGIADCFDTCDKGDDTVDMDNDGIPDACDDNVCVKGEKPQTECYQTAEWNEQTCSWDIIGEIPVKPITECYQTTVWNGTTCGWDIKDEQAEKPQTECYQMAEWNEQTCSWDVIGDKPMEPETECYETAVWNGTTCSWDIKDEQAEKPETQCYQMAEWNEQTCSWDITGEQPMEPETECYQMAEWNEQTCSWDITGEQPMEPETECYQIAEWNEQTCSWDITGEQPIEPETACNETAVWNEQICEWEIIENDNDCGTGTIDQCETAYARSTDENIRTCFIEIPDVSGNRWGWVNEFPSINDTYQMDLYAAAGQCDISKGALVGSVQVIYTDGAVDVTVSTLPGYKMTVAQLHVGSQILPRQGNGFTTAPGQYTYSDMVDGDFTTYTFEGISAGDADSFNVVLHADVCPGEVQNESLAVKRPVDKMELKAYPVPFKENLNLNVVSPRNMDGTLSLFNGIGQKVKDFGQHSLRKGDNEIYLSVDELPVGTYFIRMNSAYGNETLQVIRK